MTSAKTFHSQYSLLLRISEHLSLFGYSESVCTMGAMASTTFKESRRQLVGAFVDPELIRRLDASAHENERTRSAEIRIALKRHLQLMSSSDSSRSTE